MANARSLAVGDKGTVFVGSRLVDKVYAIVNKDGKREVKVLASGLYRRIASRMRGYDEAQARLIFRDLIDMPADVAIADGEITVRFHRRAHLPIVLASGILDKPVAVPWWHGYSLRFVQNRPAAAGVSRIPVRGNPG